MRFVTMPGLSRPVAALALGTADVETAGQADALYDAYVAAGGNLFDTAWIYRQGEAETLFGAWLARRQLHSSVVIIGKGAHTPHCSPDAVGTQLDQSLQRLQLDRVDVYMMHRDDPDIPVGEFVDAIAVQISAGRIGSYGFSNWSLARVDAAIAYARATGHPVATAVSNNFSLAQMVEPVWDGCVSANDAAWRARLAQGDLGLYAWSSQARGFFTGRAGPAETADPELVRCWYSAGNFERREQAQALGEARGKTANQVALAYCLAQPFPLIPLIGPLKVAELENSLSALEIALSEDERRRLEA